MFLVPVSRRSPALSRSFNGFFDDALFDRFFASTQRSNATPARSPALEVIETEQAYTVTVDLPGIAKDQVKITIEGRRVDIEAQALKLDDKKDSDRIVYSERSVASFARSLTLPVDIHQEASEARLENGVLTLTLAKKQAAGSRQIEVK
ncbi:Hsp20/alpha crystallin family protein [Aquabacterium sp.]|uniref:Hsp20/alpha crystallin family protein n=1 Tax=Aquabacterium sp. TaxID=1872578 RepID=UPI002C84CF0E|nr:Hsp20/alpha crystallin family protein [Aquabacterium sp.]HSW03267.1 Hsp20/alpha crystallin family protein [Aquabacterium sp.]